MSAFIIDLATLQPGLNRLALAGEPVELELPAADWPGSIQAELSVEKNGERVSVRGRLSAVTRLDCVRCTRSFEWPLRVPLEVYAERTGSGRHVDHEAELERDDYMRFHDGRHLDLREEMREVLLLEIPMAPRCREDCRGLCPNCGADLNEGPCGCVTTAG